MATIEDSIKTYVLSQSAITAYIGDLLYHAGRPQGLTGEYICYEMIIPSNDPYAFGDTNTAQPSFQFSIFSQRDDYCIAIGNLLVTALNHFQGTLGTGGNVVINSTANGPMVRRDESDDEWFMGIVEWFPEYER